MSAAATRECSRCDPTRAHRDDPRLVRTASRLRPSRPSARPRCRVGTRRRARLRASGSTARTSTDGRGAGRSGGAPRARAPARSPRRARVPGSTLRFTRPMRTASSPETPRPVRMRSSACDCPTRRGSRMVPPSTSGHTPPPAVHAEHGIVRGDAQITPHCKLQPARATACPSTAAMTGLPSSMRVGPIGPSPSSRTALPRPSDTAFKSAPAQNVPPAPVRIATRWSSSASKARNASASEAAVGRSTALRTAGRSIVTIVTGPSCSTRTVMASSSRTSARARSATRPTARPSGRRPCARSTCTAGRTTATVRDPAAPRTRR